TEESIQSYELARAFEQAHPPNSIPTDITPELRQLIQEKGVFAWHFGGDLDLNVIVNDRTELTFLGGDNCIQTNIPIPKQQPIYYFEVKMFEMSNTTKVAVGLATKPYPSWRFPGMNKNSLGYFSNDGRKRYNDPFSGQEFGPTYCEGDVIGCGYRPRSGTVFFTKNGVKIGDSQSGFRYNLFPTISADGPCQLHVNLGQMGFVFIEANVGKWGLAPCEGSLLPPPAYGQVRDSILL
ncbi:SPRY-domain-containing protein, partial [Neoconidiobolus thromboides FSU 785]